MYQQLAYCIDIPRKLRAPSPSVASSLRRSVAPPTPSSPSVASSLRRAVASPATFACRRCHNIRFTSSICKDYWNDIITYLTAGLLYGKEVPRPKWLKPERKNQYAPRPTREPSKRRPQVLELLLQGKSYAQIGAELGLSKRTVNDYACIIYKQHGVKSHHARRDLAKKLNRPSPPAKPSKRHDIRLPQVLDLLLRGQTHKQIAAALGLKPRTVNCYICMIYKQHGVSGHHARESLAQILHGFLA